MEKARILCTILLLCAVVLGGCKEGETMSSESVNTMTGTTPATTPALTATAAEKWSGVFAAMKKADTLKLPIYNNPLMVQRLGADPYALVYDGRVYIYMTGDVIETGVGGKPAANSYSKINTTV